MQRVWAHLDKNEEVAVDEDSRLLKYPEVSKHNLADKLRTHIYASCKKRAEIGDDSVDLLCKDIHNAANHWGGDHSVCQDLDPRKKFVLQKWGAEKAYYIQGGETHVAVKEWLVKKCTPSKMKFYTRARENYLSETFNSVISKYAIKRIHYSKSHLARVACAGLDKNEGRDRIVLVQKQRKAAGTTVRQSVANKNVLFKKTTEWKTEVARRCILELF
jgi:hypothetical protein